jgi:hypothetical protein
VGDSGQDLPLDVGEDRRERLALFGWRGGKRVPQLARTKARENRELLAVGQIGRDPVDEAAAFLTEGLEVDVSRQG